MNTWRERGAFIIALLTGWAIGSHHGPKTISEVVLGMPLFILGAVLYFIASDWWKARREAPPNSKSF